MSVLRNEMLVMELQTLSLYSMTTDNQWFIKESYRKNLMIKTKANLQYFTIHNLLVKSLRMSFQTSDKVFNKIDIEYE